ncbi:MAG: ribosome biogenesis GTPase Der [Candidatus Cloacimonetes bacterium]|nr:ribosome biogenesis GTPase Der [Candidatus Cloacimonadota bacterium]
MSNKPIVAIVGRPNVGKSTLFNRFCRKRSAIVDFEEGITRDRKYETVDWNGRDFLVVDTGGIIPDSDLTMDKAVKMQAQIAIEQADVIIFLCDIKTGITKYDMQIAKILSNHRDKLILAVNKVDNEKDELDLYDFMRLGLGEPIGIAAISGRNMGNFLDDIVNILPINMENDHDIPYSEDDSSETQKSLIKVAIVGKPNVGKSSLINKLIGEDTVIVTDIPGTTRDSIDLEMEYEYKPENIESLENDENKIEKYKIVIIDTAGLRKKARVKYGVEYFSTMRTIESIDKADIIVLILDSFEDFSDQDQKIAAYAQRNFKNIIVVLNKWDLIENKDNKTFNNYVKKVREEFEFLQYAPILTISALTGQRVNKVPELICQVWEESNKRISTGELNRFFERIIMKKPPTHSTGKHIKILYVTQQKVNPPTFIFFTNEPKLIPEHYKRFLRNKIREEFKFTGATIKLVFKGKNDDSYVVEY